MDLRFLLVLFIPLFMLGACDSDELCLSNQHALQVGVYSTHTSTLLQDKDTILVDVSIFGAEKEDSIYESEVLKEAFLPLSFTNDTTTYIIKVSNEYETIRFVHKKELDFVSGECGYVFKFQIEAILFSRNNFIDSVSITYPHVKYGEDFENVKIYIY